VKTQVCRSRGKLSRSRVRGGLTVILSVLITLVFLSGGLPRQAQARYLSEPTETRVTVAYVGDLLMHIGILASARTGAGYNFSPIFAPMAPYLRAPDYTVANLETRFGGPELGYSGYPRFNCPTVLGPQLKAFGVDLMETANNHCMDMGWTGIFKTLDNLDAAQLAHVGTARSAAEQARVFILDLRGVKIAFLNYTFSTNGIPLPSGRPWAVNMISRPAILAEAGRARAAGADLVVALLHWGTEYERYPNAAQKTLARQLFEGGVDLIVAAHPHVVQPIEKMKVMRNGQTLSCYVVYSLGNFVSDQRARYRDSGLMVFVDILKDTSAPNGRGTRVSGIRYLPVYVQKTYITGTAQFRVLPASPDIALPLFPALSGYEKQRMRQVYEELRALVDRPADQITAFRQGALASGTLGP
jgi:poly-gamma-glutamate capsule biosynthesis protein CapA/YwtB (metallophosphatase superfamily)